MNPNKKKERFHWVLRRLDLVSDGSGGLRLALQSAETSERPRFVISSEDENKIPIGKLNYQGRAKLRESMVELDKKRTALIEQRDKERKERFLAKIAEEKRAAEEAAKLRERKIKEERDEKRAQQLRDRYEVIKRETRQNEIDEKRNGNMAVLKARRQANEKNIINAFIERQKKIDKNKKDKEEGIKKKAADRMKRDEDERRQYENYMRELDSKREAAWRRRDARLRDHAAAQNLRRQQALDTQSTRNKLLLERKVEAISGMNEERRRVYAEYRKEKEQLNKAKADAYHEERSASLEEPVVSQ